METIVPISARLVANKASYAFKKEKIENILILSSSYIVQQCLYFFIISKLFLILS